MAETSTKPYMIRAIYEWCCDNGYTPYLAVKVDGRTLVPVQHVRNGEIVLNISPMATNAMQLGNDLIEFQARFNGVPEYLSVPVGNVLAIYARETGSGMAFSPDLEHEAGFEDEEAPSSHQTAPGGAPSPHSPPASPASAPAPSPATGGEVLAFARPQRGETGARTGGQTSPQQDMPKQGGGQASSDEAAPSSASSSPSPAKSAPSSSGSSVPVGGAAAGASADADAPGQKDKLGRGARGSKGAKDKVAKVPQPATPQPAPVAAHPQKPAEPPQVGQNKGIGPEDGNEPPPGGGKPRLVRVK